MKKIKWLLLSILIPLLSPQQSRAQNSDYRIHSVFLYNFTKYFNWKEDNSHAFVIAILGNSIIKSELEKRFIGKTVNNKQVQVREFKSVEDISDCHILFLPALQSHKIDAVLTKIQGKSTLLVTDMEGLGKKGSSINFIEVDGKLRFELNKAALQSSGIRASSEIERLSIII